MYFVVRCNFFTLANIFHIGLFYFNAFYLYPRFLTRQKWGLYMLWIVGLFYKDSVGKITG